MSETAVSSQISAKISPKQSGVSETRSGELNNAQGSEFKEVLGEQLQGDKNLKGSKHSGEPPLIDLNALLNSNPNISANQTPLVNASGNILPTNLAGQNQELLMQNAVLPNNNALLMKNMPLEGEYKANVALLTPAAHQKLSPELGGKTLTSQGDDLFLAQANSLFNEKNMPNIKQLNNQLFNQVMLQAATQKQPNVDNAVLTGAAPGIIVNQSLSVNSSEAVLPAMTVQPNSPQWNAQLGERINWMVSNNIQRADIRLDPPELGNLDIRLHMAKDNQASILVHVTNASAKEAIESAIPRLREMFEQQGLNLGDVDVSQQNSSEQQTASEQFNEDNSNASSQENAMQALKQEIADEDILARTNISSQSNQYLVDTFV